MFDLRQILDQTRKCIASNSLQTVDGHTAAPHSRHQQQCRQHRELRVQALFRHGATDRRRLAPPADLMRLLRSAEVIRRPGACPSDRERRPDVQLGGADVFHAVHRHRDVVDIVFDGEASLLRVVDILRRDGGCARRDVRDVNVGQARDDLDESACGMSQRLVTRELYDCE